ncbi:MAG TPA: wax ester/triacylglycerol synthase family O-acyltransferase [Solirubrobacterales bacterium]|nr:wax ester/triacylglycerol synthase family O-acyltransferase [Solirubrobacterales bacterium]
MRSHLSPLDAVLLELEQEDPAAQMHVGWVCVFDPLPNGEPPSPEELREQVRERIAENSMLRRRLSIPAVGLLTLPVWLPDPDLDVGQMIRHATLPHPGSEEELTKWVGDYFSQRLDRSRPLWETTLLDGLEGGRWAYVTKLHHSLVDGISGANLVAALLDTEPEPTPEETQKKLSALVNWFTEESTRGVLMRMRGVVGEAVSGGVDAAVHPPKVREILARSRAMTETLLRDELTPAPPTSINEPIGSSRRLAGVDVPLADVERVTEELGGTLNDVVLAAVAGGLRRLFEHRREAVDSVRIMAPVGLRQASEALVCGSEVSSLFVSLPVSEPDPVARYRKILARTEEVKAGASAGGTDTAVLAGLEPSLVQTVVARLTYTPRLFTATVTPLAVAPFTLYSFGAPLRRVIPLLPIFSAHALSVTVVNYDETLFFGLHADRDAIPDIEVMRAGIEAALHELAPVAA